MSFVIVNVQEYDGITRLVESWPTSELAYARIKQLRQINEREARDYEVEEVEDWAALPDFVTVYSISGWVYPSNGELKVDADVFESKREVKQGEFIDRAQVYYFDQIESWSRYQVYTEGTDKEAVIDMCYTNAATLQKLVLDVIEAQKPIKTLIGNN